MSTLVIAAIQANPTVGAIAHNEALARERLAQARAAGADIAVFSELFINSSMDKYLIISLIRTF